MKATKLIHRYGESVLSTWETSFAAVERQSTMAERLLSLLAFLNFDDIFPALFERLRGGERQVGSVREASDPRWQSYLSPNSPLDPYTVERAFRVLQTYSLIQWRDDPGGYAMHKLVHAWGQDRDLSLIILELLIDIIPSVTGNPIFGMRLVPHVMANFTFVSSINAPSTSIHYESLDSMAAVGDFLCGLGRWSDEYEIRAFRFRKCVRERVLSILTH